MSRHVARRLTRVFLGLLGSAKVHESWNLRDDVHARLARGRATYSCPVEIVGWDGGCWAWFNVLIWSEEAYDQRSASLIRKNHPCLTRLTKSLDVLCAGVSKMSKCLESQ